MSGDDRSEGLASRPAWSLPGAPPATDGEAIVLPSSAADRFEERAEIGSGGMGRVQLVRDQWLGRLVAVKIPASAADARRLWREALITARLEHPGIVPIYDLGIGPGGGPWFAMRVVRGRSLAELLREGGSADARVRLLRPLLAACEAIGYAHRQGVVHRDVKPANLMIGPFGEMQVIDWGLALCADMPGSDLGSAGTRGYMSPEQERGAEVDARSDVWSLGVVLREVLGADPGPNAVLVSPEVPVELRAIVQRCLRPRPEQRYPDAKALADDLARYLDGRRVQAHSYTTFELVRRVARAWRGPLVVVAASLVVLAVILVAGIERVRTERDTAEANLAISLTREAQRALDDDRLLDAQLLAGEALERGAPTRFAAEARGVLSAAGATLPRYEELTPVPCMPADVDEGLLLCHDRSELSMWQGEARLWSRVMDHGAVTMAGEMGVLVQSGAEVIQLDERSGAVTRRLLNPCHTAIGLGLTRLPDGRVVTWSQGCAMVIELDGVTRLPDAPCGEPGTLAVAGNPDGARIAFACADGSLAVWEEPDTRRFESGFGSSDKPPLISALAFAGDELLVGSADGSLAAVVFGPSLARRPLTRQHGLVRRILVAPRGDRALVVADASAPLVLDLERGAPLLRLPGRSPAAARFDSRGRLLTASVGDATAPARVSRWDLAALMPRRARLPDGVTRVAISPLADGPIALGDGARLVVLSAERKLIAEHRWQDSIIKTLGFDARGLLIAHGQGAMEVRAFDPTTPIGAYRTPSSIWRRIAVLADGRIMGANHQHRRYLMRRDAPWVELGQEPLVDLVASSDGRHMATLFEGGEVRCAFALEPNELPHEAPCAHAPRGLALALDGRHIFVLEAEGVEVWDASHEGAAIRHLRHDARGTELTSLAAAGGLVAAGARDGAVWIWRGDEPAPLAIAHTHAGRVDSVAIEPGGRWLVAGGWDGWASFIEARELESRRAMIMDRFGVRLQDLFAVESFAP